jgi:hypothetical protein
MRPCVKNPQGVRPFSRNLSQEQIFSITMRNYHAVIVLAILFLPFSPVDNSRMAGHYWQTLPVVWEG